MPQRLFPNAFPSFLSTSRSRSSKHNSADQASGSKAGSAPPSPNKPRNGSDDAPKDDGQSEFSNGTEERAAAKDFSARNRAREFDPKELEKRQHEEKEFIRQNDSQETSIWYLVDVNWLQEWKEFVKRGATLPGPIDNSSLVDENNRPRSNVRVVQDYRGVNATVWEFWYQRYGGGPVVRRKQLDLYSDPVEDDDLDATMLAARPAPRDPESTGVAQRDREDRGRERSRIPERPPTKTWSHPPAERPPTSSERPAARGNTKKSNITGAVTGALSRGKSVPPGRATQREAPAKPLCCDKCDGPHETDDCPHFKKPREKHKDAWTMLGKGGLASACSALAPIVRSARVVRQPGDGSCLFHSLSYGLADGSSGSSLRREICSFIARNPEIDIGPNTLKEWIQYESGTTVDAYAQNMSGGTWGGAIEMASLTRMKGVSVHVYEKSSEGYKRISTFEGGSKIINVVYQGRMHYDALVI